VTKFVIDLDVLDKLQELLDRRSYIKIYVPAVRYTEVPLEEFKEFNSRTHEALEAGRIELFDVDRWYTQGNPYPGPMTAHEVTAVGGYAPLTLRTCRLFFSVWRFKKENPGNEYIVISDNDRLAKILDRQNIRRVKTDEF
jgi:hypothetical protein